MCVVFFYTESKQNVTYCQCCGECMSVCGFVPGYFTGVTPTACTKQKNKIQHLGQIYIFDWVSSTNKVSHCFFPCKNARKKNPLLLFSNSFD
jgi:hypothetical protein